MTGWQSSGELPSGLLNSCTLWPVGLELGIADLQILHHVSVVGQEVVVGAGFEKFLLHRQPRCFVDPHSNSGDLAARLFGLRRQLQHYGLAAVEIFLSDECQDVILLERIAFRSESQRQILVGKRTVLSDVIFLDAINLRRENVKRIAVSEDRSRIGLLEIDAHLVVATHENLAGLGRGILHYRGVFDVFDIGCEGVKVLRGLVHHAQDAFDAVGIVVDWIDACKQQRLDVLLDLYDDAATIECREGGTFRGRSAMEWYWRSKLAGPAARAFEIDALCPEPDGVSLDYRGYDGKPVRTHFRFNDAGKITLTRFATIKQAA